MANKDKLLESAQKFLAKGQLAKAIGEYQKLIEAFPKDYRNRQKLAELLGREKRNDEAQPHYEAVAKNFAETGFYLKAIAIYKQMQKIEPSRVDIYLRLAELNEKQGLIGNALNEYRSLVAFYDKNHMARETVGVLQKMIALEPENLGVRGKLIETLTASGEESDALEQFRTLVRLLASKGESAKVVKLYEKFSDLAPEDVDNRLPLGTALLASDQADKALTLLKGLLKQAPDHADLLLVLTDCHLALGNHADARLTCQHLLKEQPHNLELRERYIRICLDAKEHERALESLEEAKELFSAANRVGVLKELYESLQAALPDNARLQATLAAIYETTGDAGSRPVFAAAERPAMAEEETADAAILDAAISDVEQLDLVGEAVAPVVEVPPLGAPAVPLKPAKGKGGLELELDLDLDLDLEPPVATAVPAATVPEPPSPPVAQVKAPQPAAEMEMELELDLGELGELSGLEIEPPLAESLLSPAASEPEAAVEDVPETAAEDVTEVAAEDVTEVAAEDVAEVAVEDAAEAAAEEDQPTGSLEVEAPAEASALPDFAEFDFEVESPLTEPSVLAAEPQVEPAAVAPSPAVTDMETFAPDLTEAFELLDEGDAVTGVFAEEAGEVSEPPSVVPEDGFVYEATADAELSLADAVSEAVEEPEVLEELEEVEDLEEIDSLNEVESCNADEPLEDLEELEELEDLEDIVAEDEPGPVGIAAFSVHRLRDDLEEAEFFLRQGLFDDAERVVVSLQGRYAEHPELDDKLAEIRAQRQASAELGEQTPVSELMSDLLDDELLGATDFLGEAAQGSVDEFSLEAAAEDDEDAQSHFDLGIAYKEMGLLDDAIAEFGKAARDNSRRLDCLILKGQCQVEMGEIGTAETTFKEALGLSSLTDEVRVALRYELGLLYENSGRLLEALECYQIVADHDLFFRDVTDKLKSLRQTLGLDDDLIEPEAPTGNRDRISFI